MATPFKAICQLIGTNHEGEEDIKEPQKNINKKEMLSQIEKIQKEFKEKEEKIQE